MIRFYDDKHAQLLSYTSGHAWSSRLCVSVKFVTDSREQNQHARNFTKIKILSSVFAAIYQPAWQVALSVRQTEPHLSLGSC